MAITFSKQSGVFGVVRAVCRLFNQSEGRGLVKVIWRCAEDAPPHQTCRVIFFHIAEKSFRGDMPTARPNAALNFKGYLMFGESVIEPPPPFGVEAILLDAVQFQVSFTDDRKNVS